jgi:hypothetical protein
MFCFSFISNSIVTDNIHKLFTVLTDNIYKLFTVLTGIIIKYHVSQYKEKPKYRKYSPLVTVSYHSINQIFENKLQYKQMN